MTPRMRLYGRADLDALPDIDWVVDGIIPASSTVTGAAGVASGVAPWESVSLSGCTTDFR